MKESGSQSAIVVKNLTKTFRIPLDKGQSVKNKVLGKAGKGYREFTPLNDVSFTINKGDFFAIVGRNGSGKSTLLKTIAGIYEPTRGKVEVNGVLVPFIELGVGFNPQLTGRENVYLNAALLGFSRKETDEMYDKIVDFAELHDFMEERLQNYSSGMQVRLAFSIAIRAKADVLLLDEVLAVGDAAFQEKCFKYFEQLKREKKTVILVTHSMANVDRFCNRGLLLDEGRIAFMGSSQELADRYRELFAINQDRSSHQKMNSAMVEKATLEDVLLSQGGNTTKKIAAGEDFTINARIRLKEKFRFCTVVLRINDVQEKTVLAVDTATESLDFFKPTVERSATISFSIKNFYANGRYSVNLQIKASDNDGKRLVLFDRQNIAQFEVVGRKSSVRSLFYPPVDISSDS